MSTARFASLADRQQHKNEVARLRAAIADKRDRLMRGGSRHGPGGAGMTGEPDRSFWRGGRRRGIPAELQQETTYER